MLFNLINRQRSAFMRRLMATLMLLAIPLLVVVALIAGSVGYLVDWTKTLCADLYQLFTLEVPTAVKQLVRVIRTGGAY